MTFAKRNINLNKIDKNLDLIEKQNIKTELIQLNKNKDQMCFLT